MQRKLGVSDMLSFAAFTRGIPISGTAAPTVLCSGLLLGMVVLVLMNWDRYQTPA